jgi:hypothetical protein
MRLLADGGRFARTDERRAEQFKTLKPADERLTRPWAAGGGAIVGERRDRGGDEGDGHSSRANLRGLRELDPLEYQRATVPAHEQHIRRPGSGRKRLNEQDPGLESRARESSNGIPCRFRTFVDISDRGDPPGSAGTVPIAATRRDGTGRCVPECR